jgi:hypothetical protein
MLKNEKRLRKYLHFLVHQTAVAMMPKSGPAWTHMELSSEIDEIQISSTWVLKEPH